MKTILITGGSGFLGRHLAVKLRDNYKVILASRNNNLNRVAETITGCAAAPLDVSNIESVKDVFSKFKPDVVIHAAATKFVDLSEKYPMECIDVNVLGSQNIARVSIDKGVETVIGISTDKAAPPVGNIYGLSKAMMERTYCELNGVSKTQFACVRFGNIAWSTGSVFPVWKRMVEKDGIIQSTGPEMRRFFFTVNEAVDLIIRAIENIHKLCGKALSLKMKSAQIEDILDVWTKNLGGKWGKIETRPGDNIDEILIGEIELENTVETTIDGLPHYMITFNQKFENHVTELVSSENAERLTEEDILNIITNEPELD